MKQKQRWREGESNRAELLKDPLRLCVEKIGRGVRSTKDPTLHSLSFVFHSGKKRKIYVARGENDAVTDPGSIEKAFARTACDCAPGAERNKASTPVRTGRVAFNEWTVLNGSTARLLLYPTGTEGSREEEEEGGLETRTKTHVSLNGNNVSDTVVTPAVRQGATMQIGGGRIKYEYFDE